MHTFPIGRKTGLFLNPQLSISDLTPYFKKKCLIDELLKFSSELTSSNVRSLYHLEEIVVPGFN